MNYPSPCDSCTDRKCEAYSGAYLHCQAWLTRYRYRQKQINAFANKPPQMKMPAERTHCFTYDHPDDVRRFLRSHPCKGCPLEPTCDTPCGLYLHWYNARIELARRRAKI